MAKYGSIGVIGVGNMGTALIKGILNNGVETPERVLAFDPVELRLMAFCKDTGARGVCDNVSLVRGSDTVILAVKPNKAACVLTEIAGELTREKLLISIVLGLRLEELSSLGGGQARLVRCMPNTPAMVNAGVTCVTLGKNTNEADRLYVEKLFGAVGIAEFMPESDIDRVTALTGSSPAYVFMMIEAMSDAAVLCGFKRSVAIKLASQAVLGSAKMVLESGIHPAALKDMVCSPAGSTIEAVRVLEEKGFRGGLIAAMIACQRRSDEIRAEKHTED